MQIPTQSEIDRATVPGTMAHKILSANGETFEAFNVAMRAREFVPYDQPSNMRATKIMGGLQITQITLPDDSCLMVWEFYGDRGSHTYIPMVQNRSLKMAATLRGLANLFWDASVPTVNIYANAKGLH
jgi:hypothetical protein